MLIGPFKLTCIIIPKRLAPLHPELWRSLKAGLGDEGNEGVYVSTVAPTGSAVCCMLASACDVLIYKFIAVGHWTVSFATLRSVGATWDLHMAQVQQAWWSVCAQKYSG